MLQDLLLLGFIEIGCLLSHGTSFSIPGLQVMLAAKAVTYGFVEGMMVPIIPFRHPESYLF